PCVTTPIVPDAHLSVPSHGHHRDLHSSPTRRSSDLPGRPVPATRPGDHRRRRPERAATRTPGSGCPAGRASSSRPARLRTKLPRSEEHTSELQSRENLVCRLLLEKKNDKNTIGDTTI